MRDIAIRVLRDGASMDSDTGVAMCKAFLELESQLANALDISIAAHESVIQSEILRVSALDDALQQRTLAIQLSEENRALRLEAIDYLDLQVHADHDHLDNGLQWDGGEDTVVQETPTGRQ
jgi:hypothetical protein